MPCSTETRIARNADLLRAALISERTFSLVVRTADKDLLTLVCALCINFASQQLPSPRLLPHLRRHRQEVHALGDCTQSAARLRATLLSSARHYHRLLCPLIRVALRRHA